MKKIRSDLEMEKKLHLRKLFLVMKLTLFLIVLGVVSSTAKSYSQKIRLQLDYDDTTIKEIFSEIENKSNYTFIYSNDDFDIEERVSVKVNNASIQKICDVLLKDSGMSYSIFNDLVILKRQRSNSISDGNSEQENISIKGKVTDSSDLPLPGVSVIIKGTMKGTVTDVDGNFVLTNIPENTILEFSFVGMKNQELTVAGKTNIKVVMEDETIGLDEVVAIGYGNLRKRDLTGSITSINSEIIRQQPTVTFEQSLQGRVSGVQVTQSSNAPGGGLTMRIRGGNSINAGNEPLYVIDGIPIYNDNDAYSPIGLGISKEPSASALASLNVNDIESLEVLKDASATAIYGSRGSNGVVIITTKRGKAGQNNVNYDAYFGVQEAATKIDVMNREQYIQFYNDLEDARKNNGRGDNDIPLSDEVIAQFADTDWQDELFRLASVQNHQLTFNGGNKAVQYNASANYYDQNGVVTGTDFKRLSGRLNLDVKATDWLTLGNSFSFSHNIRNAGVLNGDGGTQGFIYSALHTPPIVPVYDEEGNYYSMGRDWMEDTGLFAIMRPGVPIINTPLAAAHNIKNNTVTNRTIGNFYAEIKPIKNIKVRTTFGGDVSDAYNTFFVPANLNPGKNTNGVGTVATARNINWINTNTLTYNNKFNEIHSVTFLLGSEFQENTNKKTYMKATDFFTENLGAENLGIGANYNAPYNYSTEWSIASFFSRVNYQLKDRYLFTATIRADGSSRFGVGNKWGYFPSVALGWRASEESFIKQSIPSISNLKFRTSMGITGNTEIGTYQSLSTLSTTRTILGDTPVVGLAPDRIPNPDLRWEQTQQADIGFDLGLFNNRININTDFYIKKTKDLLFDFEVPYSSGFSSSLQNIGSIQNKGVDFSLQADIVRKKDFSWSFSGNISANRNKVLDLGGNNDIEVGDTGGNISASHGSLLRVGEPVGVFYGNVFAGMWQSEEEIEEVGLDLTASPGDPRYEDIDGDKTFSYSNDRTIIGDPNPDFIYGLTNMFSYKGFDLSVFLQGSQGNDILNFTRVRLMYAYLGGTENWSPAVLNSWKEGRATNTTTDVPLVGGASRTAVDTRLIEDGSYLSIKNVRLGYTFHDLNFLKALNVYFNIQNLYTFTNYSGYDPDVNWGGQDNLTQGTDLTGHPIVRTWSFGVNVTL
nr:TonB-dependent receptor [uncultured Draconibacterium sp.]